MSPVTWQAALCTQGAAPTLTSETPWLIQRSHLSAPDVHLMVGMKKANPAGVGWADTGSVGNHWSLVRDADLLCV